MTRKFRVWGKACLVVASLACVRIPASAIPLDSDGDIKLGVRTYVNARIGTQETDHSVGFTSIGSGATAQIATTSRSRTYPVSGAGHLRQNRYFLEAELKHDLNNAVKRGTGPLGLLRQLPFRVRDLHYDVTFRGEADMIYDFGPNEYSSRAQYGPCSGTDQIRCVNTNPATGFGNDAAEYNAFINQQRHHLRGIGTDRERLFQAYLDGTVGPVFVRFGRQILAWGETDGFRLLDQINPVDSSFGGFLIPLDERRVPLDMLRVNYRLPDIGPFTDSYLEMYGAIDNKVGFAPGTPAGSPWTLPNLGAPSFTTVTEIDAPARTFHDIRGGGRLAFNAFDATFSVAHYYTYFDTPGLEVFVRPRFPVNRENIGDPRGPDVAFPPGYSALAIQSAPLVQVSGASTTFALPSWYSVVRSEFAYFKGEPRFRQEEIDPFVYHLTKGNQDLLLSSNIDQRIDQPLSGGRRVGDSINYVLGLDANRYIRFLNPNQTFFITSQVFYKHLVHPGDTDPIALSNTCGTPTNPVPCRGVTTGEVLPVPEKEIAVPTSTNFARFGAVEPRFIRQHTNQFLQTLFITTSYMSGQVVPGMLVFYDWSGSFVYQPSITLVRDPFRFSVDYSILDAGGPLKGDSGVSLLRDRDNIQFRFEYVI